MLTSRQDRAADDPRRHIWLVQLTGPNTTLAVPLATLPSINGWTAYSVRLDPSAGWKHLASSSGATADEIRDVLSSIVQLQILGDYTGGSREIGAIDDIGVFLP